MHSTHHPAAESENNGLKWAHQGGPVIFTPAGVGERLTLSQNPRRPRACGSRAPGSPIREAPGVGRATEREHCWLLGGVGSKGDRHRKVVQYPLTTETKTKHYWWLGGAVSVPPSKSSPESPLCTLLVYEETFAEEKSVINHHIFQNASRFGVTVDEENAIRNI